MNAACGFGPLREYWLAINRNDRDSEARLTAKRKTADKKRKKCACEAYPWPHRPGGGFCKWPDPPTERYERKKPSRPYADRHAGLRRQIARANGLHPIRDRKLIDSLMPSVIALAKQLKQSHPDARYREIEITENGIRGHLPASCPEWRR